MSILVSLGLLLLLASSAQAGQGWYLLLPPLDRTTQPPGKIDVDAPLRNWDQFAAYDSARECEAQIRESSVRDYSNVNRNPADATMKTMIRGAWARCVASDDPRLKP